MSIVAPLIDSLSDTNDGIWKEKLRKAVNILLTIEDWNSVTFEANW